MRGHELLRLLSTGQFYSGQSLADQLGVSRTAVWNNIQYLKKLGLDVFAVQGKGYRLAYPLELLDAQKITTELSSPAAGCVDLEVFSEIDSTNRYLLKRMYETSPGRVRACLAEYQNAGRGRRGRQWISPFGANIYLSLLWRFERGLEAIEGLSLVVALSLVKALEKLGVSNPMIKWPNDIHCEGKKLAGILLEMSGEASGPCHIVIGVGMNVNMSRFSDTTIDQPWTDISEKLGDLVSRNRVAAVLLENMLETLAVFERKGFAEFKNDWQQYDVLVNKEIEVQETNNMRQGIARGIDDSGALLLETSRGQQRILSGDVSVRVSRD